MSRELILLKLSTGDDIIGGLNYRDEKIYNIERPMQIRLLWPTPIAPIIYLTPLFYYDNEPKYVTFNAQQIVTTSVPRETMQRFYKYRLETLTLVDFDNQVNAMLDKDGNPIEETNDVFGQLNENHITGDDILSALGITPESEDDEDDDYNDDTPPDKKKLN